MQGQPTSHEELTRLIPWYVEGSLEAEDKDRLDAHLGECTSCREQVESWMQIGNAVADQEELADGVMQWQLDPKRLQGLMARIGNEAEAAAPSIDRRSSGLTSLERAARWWTQRAMLPRWSVGLQTAALAALALFLVLPGVPSGPDGGEFVTRSSVTQNGVQGIPRLIVTFRADATEAEIRAVLLDAKAQLVAGPSPLGVYEVAAASSGREDLRDRLRESGVVVLVEHKRGSSP